MNKPIMLDAGPLGRIAHPRPKPEIALWLEEILAAGVEIVIPEIADYEVRRNLLLADLTKSVERLDHLKQFLTYLPLTTSVMMKAAQLWAEARKTGQPTADPKEMDCDVVLAAQALEIGALIATENIGHLSRFLEAKHWRDIIPPNGLSILKVDMNVIYPLKDFLEDLNELHDASQSKIIYFPPSLEMLSQSGKVEKWFIRPSDPNYKIYVHYIRKYGTSQGLALCYRYFQVMLVLNRHLNQLKQAEVVKVIKDGFDVADDLFEHLLSFPLQEESGGIPEEAIRLYLESKQSQS